MRTKSKGELLRAIVQRRARVCILGLGYVGLHLAVRFKRAGFQVAGIDVDKQKIEKIKKGVAYVRELSASSSTLRSIVATTGAEPLRDADVVIICVPTPLSKTRDPDISSVLEAGRVIARRLRRGQLIVMESTTFPGTTRELLLPLFEETGLKVGTDFFLAYSPERVDPGNRRFTLVNTPKVVAGITRSCSHLAQNLYSQIVKRVVPVSGTDMAEMVKLLENIFRSVNIALVNEFAIMCHRLGLNVWEAISAAATKPYGFMPFYPGPGLGGHCIPVDPHYLSWKLRLLAYKARFIDLADEVNREMPRFVVEKVAESLNRRRKSVNRSRILVLGVAYKKDSDDVRESPAIDIIKLLREGGAAISYHDPYVAQLAVDGQPLRSVPLSPRSLASYDLVIVVTNHGRFDPRKIVKHSRLVIDTRNLTRGIASEKIVRL